MITVDSNFVQFCFSVRFDIVFSCASSVVNMEDYFTCACPRKGFEGATDAAESTMSEYALCMGGNDYTNSDGIFFGRHILLIIIYSPVI